VRCCGLCVAEVVKQISGKIARINLNCVHDATLGEKLVGKKQRPNR
jgi:hypothetical protein